MSSGPCEDTGGATSADDARPDRATPPAVTLSTSGLSSPSVTRSSAPHRRRVAHPGRVRRPGTEPDLDRWFESAEASLQQAPCEVPTPSNDASSPPVLRLGMLPWVICVVSAGVLIAGAFDLPLPRHATVLALGCLCAALVRLGFTLSAPAAGPPAPGTAHPDELTGPADRRALPAALASDVSAADIALRIDELRSALEHGDLEVHLQPQVDLSNGSVVGAEALARWRHPQDGVLLPGSFLPLAAQTGLMRPVAALVLDRALRACAQWWRRGHHIPVSVNLTADDLRDPGVSRRISECLAQHRLPACALRIEITEDILLTDPEPAGRLLQAWQRAGIAVAIDDFGTGYSSLGYLRDLPFDELKLDRSFVRDLHRCRTATIVRHTVSMAHGLGTRVVAEGIEDQATAGALADVGCDIGQGLYFGPAMTLSTFLTHLDQSRP